MTAAAPNVDIMIGGKEVSDADFLSYVVERDMFQPDMAAVILSNQNNIYGGKFEIGMPFDVNVGNPPKPIFQGEICGFEGQYKGGDKTTLLIRGMNRMHRLLRKRTSVTFTDKSDKQLIEMVCKSAELKLDFKHEKPITYKHVYQHNQTDLEFIRTRAARIGCHVWCVNDELFVKEPNFKNVGKLTLSVEQGGTLRSFTPRLSSASIVKKVTVKGWNPETKELITGDATMEKSPLGKRDAAEASGKFGKEETFTVDHPIWSVDEAKALAKARLRDLNLTYITGEAECAGQAEVQLGEVVDIMANSTKEEDPFNGKYYIMGITHRHTMPKLKDGGFVTILKLARDAQGGE